MRNFKATYLLCFVLLVAFTASVWMRIDQYQPLRNYRDLDASYHTLLTVKALGQTPVSIHRGLPIVTLGDRRDKGIPWGAALSDVHGNYYYTSFPQLPFFVTWLAFTLFHLNTSIFNLMLYNFGIHLLAIIACCLFSWRLARLVGATRQSAIVVSCLCGLIYIFNIEALYSHGIVYWGHSWFQVVYYMQLLCLSYLIPKRDHEVRYKLLAACLFVVSYLGPAFEWSGYVANAGVILIIFAYRKHVANSRLLITVTVMASLLAIITFVCPFILTVPFRELMSNVITRASIRSAQGGTHGAVLGVRLLLGYFESYGLYCIFVVWYLVRGIWSRRRSYCSLHKADASRSPVFWLLLAGFPLLENVIMMGHAVSYTYDRLKFLFVLTTMVSLLYPVFDNDRRHHMKILLGCCMCFTIMQFWLQTTIPNRFVSLHSIRDRMMSVLGKRVWDIPETAGNDKLVKWLAPYRDATFATPLMVRGYVNLSLGRAVYECVENASDLRHLPAYGQNDTVWLLGSDVGCNVYAWQNAVVFANRDSLAAKTVAGVLLPGEASRRVISLHPKVMPFITKARYVVVDGIEYGILSAERDTSRIILTTPIRGITEPTIYLIPTTHSFDVSQREYTKYHHEHI